MWISDGAVVLGRCRCRGVALRNILGHGVGDLLIVVETRQACVSNGVLVGIVRINNDGRVLALDGRRQSQHLCKILCLRTDAVLVAVVLPGLGDLKVGELVIVCIGHGVTGVGFLNLSRGGLSAREGAVGAAGELRLVEEEALGQVALGEGVGSTGRQVGEAEIPAVLHLNRDGFTAWSIVVTSVTSLGCGTRDTSILDGCASLGVVDREPDVVVGISVVGASTRRLGVVDCQREGESGVFRRILTSDDLCQVQVGTAVIVRLERSLAGAGDIVGIAIELVGLCRARGMRIINLDEHSQHAVDNHGVHDRGHELPVILLCTELCEGEIVTRIKNLHRAVCLGAHEAS